MHRVSGNVGSFRHLRIPQNIHLYAANLRIGNFAKYFTHYAIPQNINTLQQQQHADLSHHTQLCLLIHSFIESLHLQIQEISALKFCLALLQQSCSLQNLTESHRIRPNLQCWGVFKYYLYLNIKSANKSI